MMIEENEDAEERFDEEKEIKVKIPLRYHLALHRLKVITGKQISTAVTEAVGEYFEDMDAPVAPEPGGEG